MKITKLKSGHFRVRKRIDGKNYSITFRSRPSAREVKEYFYKKTHEFFMHPKNTFLQCAEAYIKARWNILSPASVRKYTFQLKSLPKYFTNIPIAKINNFILQTMINDLSKHHKPITVHRTYGFVIAVLNMFTEKRFRITLPSIQKLQEYIPTLSDVQRLITFSHNTILEPYLYLFAYGLRIGEVLALTPNDITSTCITINKSLVIDVNNKKIIKSPKTVESTRTVAIPSSVSRLLSNGWVHISVKKLRKLLYSAQDNLNIPRFSFHKFRKFYASYLHQQNVPDKYIMKMGGWATPNIMNTIYIKTYNIEPHFLPLNN